MRWLDGAGFDDGADMPHEQCEPDPWDMDPDRFEVEDDD